MKSMMRLDKSQLPALRRITSDTTIDLAIYKAAGFTNYEALLVGGAGGKSGMASGYVSANYAARAGGGGGGSLYLSGLLSALPDTQGVTIGGQGGNGSDAGPAPGTMTAGNGGNGGDTVFGSDIAYGGKGGIGGEVSGPNSIAAIYVHSSIGGEGGWNNHGIGSKGAGGTNKNYETSGGSHLTGTAALPTAGTSIGNSGGGGGGGRGKTYANNYAGLSGSSDGAAGATNGGTNDGPPSGVSGNDGGTGGGVNAKMITGVDEYYGSGPGIFIIKFS